MGTTREPDRVFQYLPFNFAASWIVMLSCLSRERMLTLSTDLNRLADEIRLPPRTISSMCRRCWSG